MTNKNINITKQAIKDACNAFQKFFNHKSCFPKYKTKRKSTPSFFVDSDKIRFTNTHVKLEKLTDSRKQNKQRLNYIRLSERGRIQTNCDYVNPRVKFDGLNWCISVGVEQRDSDDVPMNGGIGVDLGVKDLAICSDGHVYSNINKSMIVKKLKKKKRRLQRKVSKKYLKNKKGGSYCKTRNIIKSEKQLLKLSHRLTNIRHNYTHQITSEIVNRKPKFVVLENLNVVGMMKNKHLAKAVQEQGFYEFYRQMQYKCLENNIKIITADRWFPSSKLCSRCGFIHKNLKLKDRIYVCPNCGFVIDRDFQASVNLMRYGLTV